MRRRGWFLKKHLKSVFTLEEELELYYYKCSCKDTFSPKHWRNFCLKFQCSGYIKNMYVLSFHDTILLRGVNTRILINNVLREKEGSTFYLRKLETLPDLVLLTQSTCLIFIMAKEFLMMGKVSILSCMRNVHAHLAKSSSMVSKYIAPLVWFGVL